MSITDHMPQAYTEIALVTSARMAISRPQLSGFYIAPKMEDIVDSVKPLELYPSRVTWDPSCLSNTAIDIYLISPGPVLPRVHLWTIVERHQFPVPPNHHRPSRPSSFPPITRRKAYLHCYLYNPFPRQLFFFLWPHSPF